MSDQPLVATGLRKTYGQGSTAVTALDGVDLQIAAGEAVAIMGPSGSGKSTLLHVLAGLTGADAGEVVIAGTALAGLDDGALTRFRRRQIGLVFQAFNLVPTLSALDNVALPLLLDGQSETQSRHAARTMLDRLGLADRTAHLPDQLSGGEQQRVAIGRALVGDPAVILADEPTGNLDSDRSAAICALLRDLQHEQGRSLVLVTHEAHVASYADRVVLLRDGRVHDQLRVDATGDAAALAGRYQDALAGAGGP